MVISLRKIYFVLLIVAFSAIITFILLMKTENAQNVFFEKGNYKQTIVIDAGHGGKDGGAVGADGTYEKDINLEVAKRLNELFLLNGFNVIMTREEDISTDESKGFNKRKDIRNRIELINKQQNAILISVHMNKFPEEKYWGSQMFYSAKNQDSRILAEVLQDMIKSTLQKENDRLPKPIPKSVFLFSKVNLTAVLAECGFLSNYNELSLLKTDEYKQKIALCLYLGVMKYLTL